MPNSLQNPKNPKPQNPKTPGFHVRNLGNSDLIYLRAGKQSITSILATILYLAFENSEATHVFSSNVLTSCYSSLVDRGTRIS